MAKTIFINVDASASWRLKNNDWLIRIFLSEVTNFLKNHIGEGKYKMSLSRRDTVDYDFVLTKDRGSLHSIYYKANGVQLRFCKEGFRKVFFFSPRKIYVTLEKI